MDSKLSFPPSVGGVVLVAALFAALVPLSLHLDLLRLERLAVKAADANALSGVAATLARHVRRKGLHVVPEPQGGLSFGGLASWSGITRSGGSTFKPWQPGTIGFKFMAF